MKRLYRNRQDRVLGGICGGIAAYFRVDPVFVRVAWIVSTLISVGWSLVIYVLCWMIVPREPVEGFNIENE